MNEKVFDRVEKKYLITKSQKTDLIRDISLHLDKDAYFRSTIYNIYFDTPNYDLIIKSIERPKFKEKFRARSYEGYDKVFLEMKTKLKGKDYNLGFKRRVLITHSDYNEWLQSKVPLTDLAARHQESPADLQIAAEIAHMVDHFNLAPRIFVSYARESYSGEDGLRITFDENLKYRDTDLEFKNSRKDKLYFNDQKNTIMEIKVHGAMPLWLVHTMSSHHIYPESFSKIGRIYQQIRKEQNV